ncbi:hypothetical protein FA13DRAFT_751559 [Coprinellus micaceus]|uniref:Uncharacterized protein n=1 Tax=Coprinellus micaceus TaxID=71717 RepID=A0A4Y7TWX5_COPMI|nr:hypothetical protein FA13DRAFT_751559 [Coprinellus micaceus]
MRISALAFLVYSWFWILGSAVCVPGAQSVLVLTSGYGFTNFLWSFDWYEDAWKTILEHKDQAVAYANIALEENKKKFDDVADKLDQFKAGMDTLVDHAREVQLIFEQYQADPQALLDRLNEAGTDAVENLQKEFEKPLPEDMDERAKYRAEMIASILNHMEGPYVTASEELGIPEDKARQSFEAIRRALEDTLIIAGKIVDKHPVLVETVVISAAFMILPGALFLRPFVRLFGFGPFGPVKGEFSSLAGIMPINCILCRVLSGVVAEPFLGRLRCEG